MSPGGKKWEGAPLLEEVAIPDDEAHCDDVVGDNHNEDDLVRLSTMRLTRLRMIPLKMISLRLITLRRISLGMITLGMIPLRMISLR